MDVKIVFFKPNGQRKDIAMPAPVTAIGRGEDCELRIPLPSVSRRHCELREEGGGLKVKDLASSNGTFVNNQRITEASLKAGDRLAVGPVVLTVVIDGDPSDVKPVKTRGQRMAEEGQPGAEGIIDLEADVLAGAEAGGEGGPSGAASDDDVDPIAALEALAAESDEEQETS